MYIQCLYALVYLGYILLVFHIMKEENKESFQTLKSILITLDIYCAKQKKKDSLLGSKFCSDSATISIYLPSDRRPEGRPTIKFPKFCLPT